MKFDNGAWVRRAAAGLVLATAPALIALGTAASSQAAASDPTPPSFSVSGQAPTPPSNVPWYDSSFHHRHAAQVQSFF
jgi:hypothetical protein